MRFARLVLAMLLGSLAVLPGHAQVQASSPPISRDTVTLRLMLGQTPATLAVQNGAMARLSVRGGPVLGIIPTIGIKAIDLVIVEILADPITKNEGVRQLTKVSLSPGNVVQLDSLPIPLEIELLQTSAARPQSTGASAPCTKCCTTCGDYTLCGCWVEMECGRCCCSTNCDCPWISTEATCAAVGSRPAVGPVGNR